MLDKDIARLQDRIDEAGESAKISTKHALYHAKKERAAVEIVKSVSNSLLHAIYVWCTEVTVILVYTSTI